MKAVAAVLAVLFAPAVARAAGPLANNDQPITTSDYAIDLTAGPVLAGPRALGLGGAYVAIAEGVDGDHFNAASPAVRAAWSRAHVDGDFTLGLMFPAQFSGSDFYNTGRGNTDLRRSDQRELALFAPAGSLQIGPWGIGLGAELSRFGLMRRPSPEQGGEEELVRAQVSTIRTHLARAVDDGQLVGGLGFNVTAFDVTTRDEIIQRKGNVFTTRGVSFEGGLLWRPSSWPLRAGMSLRAPVTTEVDSRGRAVRGDIVLGEPSAGGYYLPRRVKRPWSAEVGVAVQLGPRPLNVPWLDPTQLMERVKGHLTGDPDRDEQYLDEQSARLDRLLDRRYSSLPRRYYLVSAALRADGDVENAVGIESFLQQRVDRSGERVTLSPRLGVETEPLPNWLKVRAGSYYEPSRFRTIDGRAHMTGGFDVRLFDWKLFGLLDEGASLKLSGAADVARAYFGWAASLGVWH